MRSKFDSWLGDARSAVEDSFAGGGGFDHPCYTRPEEWRDLRVPEVLLSGDHAAIAAWRQQERAQRTRKKRPDLLGVLGPQEPRSK